MHKSRFLAVGAILILCLSSTAAVFPKPQTQTASQSPKPAPSPAPAPAPSPDFSTLEEFKAEFGEVPCKSNSDRLIAVQALFERLGAPPSSISIEKAAHTKNIVIRKAGTSSEIIVIGAHYDKVTYGCGAVDNWTGIVAIAHLYSTIKDLPSKKTVLFVGFGSEEEGLIGSRAMVEAISKDRLPDYCAMINIDSLGMAIPQTESRMSSKKLIAHTVDLAKRMEIPFREVSIPGVDGDSSSFLKRKIPAITIFGLSNEWRAVLHTSQDKPAKVDPLSVYAGYRLALGLYSEIENSACDAFR